MSSIGLGTVYVKAASHHRRDTRLSRRREAGGDEIQGSGGFRKGRIAGRGKGKSGGYRVVSIYLNDTIPVFLVAVLSKGDRENFTDAEVAEFKKVATAIKAAHRRPGRQR